MKKFSLGLVAAAASVACSGSFASTDFRPSATAAETRMASELSYTGTGNAITPASNRLRVDADLGFGVNNAQQRHIKVTLSSNATFASATAGANVTFATACAGTTAAWVGGGLGNSFVIYQVTGGASGCTATDDVQINLPDVFVSNNQTVTVQYSLYDGAGDAVAGTNALYSTAAANFLTFTNGLVAPTLSAGSNQVAIQGTPNFSEFGSTGVTTVGPVAVGELTLAAASGVAARAGAVTLANLSTSASTIKFSAANFGSGSSLGVAAGAASPVCSGATALTLNTALTEATFSVGNTAGTYRLCWTVSGNQAINPQTVSADYNPVAVSGATITDPAAGTIGTITREGTTLMAPYVTINPNFVTNFTFTNSGSAAATWRATVTPEAGGTCAAGTTTGTIPANGIAVVRATTVCPTISGAANNNRAQFSFSVEADSANIQGSVTTSDKNATSSPSTHLMIKNGSY